MQRFVIETDLDSICAKGTLVLAKDASLGEFHHFVEVVRIQFFADYAHRETSDELGLEPVLDEILGRDVLEQFVVHHLHWFGAEADLAVLNATRDLLFQTLESAAHDEENVARADGLPFGFAAALLKLERRLELRLQIVPAPQWDVGLLHQLEECRLHSASAHV